MRRITAFLATAALAMGVAQAGTGAVAVPLDEVRMVAFNKPVSTLYVGNPAIAEVTMIDKRHAFVLGKSYGATNVIALDSTGQQITNEQIVVSGGDSGLVTLQRGSARVTLSCNDQRCETAPRPGDSKDPFDVGMDQIQKHQDASGKIAADPAQ